MLSILSMPFIRCLSCFWLLMMILDGFVELMHSKGQLEPDEDKLGDLTAFVGVAQYPARVKCALLAWA